VLLRNSNAELPLYDEMRTLTQASHNLHESKAAIDLSFELSNNTVEE
jgi:hypothetical protein